MARKAADLNQLIRLRRWTVDERRRELGLLQTREEQLIKYGLELDRQLVREGDIAMSDPTRSGFFFGAFAGDHRLRRERLAQNLAALRVEIEQARDRLAGAYRDRRVLAEVQHVRAEKEVKEENRLDQIELDEIAANQHRLKG